MRAALALWDCRPTFSNHVALAGGQKEIANTYVGPERKLHSHENDNKGRHSRIEPISPPHLNSNYFAAKRPSPDTAVLEKAILRCDPCNGFPDPVGIGVFIRKSP
jgi:hypothetical protein